MVEGVELELGETKSVSSGSQLGDAVAVPGLEVGEAGVEAGLRSAETQLVVVQKRAQARPRREESPVRELRKRGDRRTTRARARRARHASSSSSS